VPYRSSKYRAKIITGLDPNSYAFVVWKHVGFGSCLWLVVASTSSRFLGPSGNRYVNDAGSEIHLSSTDLVSP
jgi:hypothetical protein